METITTLVLSILLFIFLTLLMFIAAIIMLIKEAKRGTLTKLQRWVNSRKRINKRQRTKRRF